MTCILGYAAASAVGQNLEAQLAALSAEGVDPRRVFTDRVSETADRARATRPALAEVHAKAVEVATQRFAEETARRAG